MEYMEQSNQRTKKIDYTSEEIQNYIALFVGEKFNKYYKKVWENKYDKEWFLSFNISAFLLNNLWFFYRKMYKEGIICGIAIGFFGNIVSTAILSVIYLYWYISLHINNDIFSPFLKLSFLLYLCSCVIIGLLGNYLYLRNVKINISKLIKEKDGENITEYLEKRKCTNIKIVIILVVIGILLSIALAFAIIFFFLYLLFGR
jgi:hypothetical protein